MVFVTGLFCSVVAQEKEGNEKAMTYGGVATCKACHMTKKSGAQYKLWKAGPHAKAFAVLKSPEAMEIAKAKGIEDPATADACLKCHVTAHGVSASLKGKKFKVSDGVGCESCHGPGSAYKGKKVMVAITAGEADGAKYGLVMPTEEVCIACHNEESPTYKEFDFKKRVVEIAHPVPKKES